MSSITKIIRAIYLPSKSAKRLVAMKQFHASIKRRAVLRKYIRIAVLILTFISIGYVGRPSVVQAASRTVVIQSGAANKPTQARVVGKRLLVDPGPPSSNDDPVKTRSLLFTHAYTFTPDPEAAPVQQTQTTNFPAVDVCGAVIPTVHNYVITGLDVSISDNLTPPPPAPPGGSVFPGLGDLTRIEVEEVQGGTVTPRFDQYRPSGFHDDTGIRFFGNATLRITTTVRGAAGKLIDPSGMGVLFPSMFEVPIVVQLYCADEALNPPPP
ncbi:MAG: hypothetical protein ACREWG_03425 [Gammaproteobacteria bacterium]